MALQGQGTDVSERIFTELRSKNLEVKTRAARDLRDLVTLYSRGNCSLCKRLQTLTRRQNGRPRDSTYSTTASLPASQASSSNLKTPVTRLAASSHSIGFWTAMQSILHPNIPVTRITSEPRSRATTPQFSTQPVARSVIWHDRMASTALNLLRLRCNQSSSG